MHFSLIAPSDVPIPIFMYFQTFETGGINSQEIVRVFWRDSGHNNRTNITRKHILQCPKSTCFGLHRALERGCGAALGVVVHLLACSGIQFDVSRSVSDELPFKKSGALPGNLKGVGNLRMDARSKMDLGCAMIQLSRCVWRCLETDTRAYMAYAAYMSYNVRQGYRYWVAYFFPPNRAMPSVWCYVFSASECSCLTSEAYFCTVGIMPMWPSVMRRVCGASANEKNRKLSTVVQSNVFWRASSRHDVFCAACGACASDCAWRGGPTIGSQSQVRPPHLEYCSITMVYGIMGYNYRYNPMKTIV